MNKKWIKPTLLTTTIASIIPITTLAVVSCTNSPQNEESISQQDIDRQFQIFHSSLVISKIKDNLYFDNFDFDKIMNIEEVNQYISIPNLNNQFIYEFKAIPETDTSVKITMQVFSRNQYGTKDKELFPSDNQFSSITIENIKSLTDDELNQLNNIYEKWKNIVISIENNKQETLGQNDYQNMLPSYLQSPNVSFKWDNNLITSSLDETKFQPQYIYEEFDDINGKISIRLNIVNPLTSLTYFPKIKDKHGNWIVDKNLNLKVIDGFCNQQNRSDQVKKIFETLVQTIDTKNITPYIASGLTTIDQIIELMQYLVDNNSNTVNISGIDKIKEKIKLLQELNTQWYDLLLTTDGANDVTGTLVCSWVIVDKFTSFQISPPNISKTTTFNNLLALVSKKEIDGNSVNDYSVIKNAWQAYNLLSQLEYKTKTILPSELNTTNTTIDNNWINNNTNIKDIVQGIQLGPDGYFAFSLISDENETINYRFKIDSINDQLITYNDSLGTISIPFIMEIQRKIGSDNNSHDEWIKFLPAKKSTNNNGEDDFGPSEREAYIQIGNFLNIDNQTSSLIYQYFEDNSNFEIKLDNPNYYQLLKEQCTLQGSKVSSYFAEQIKNQLLSSFQNNNQYKQIESLLEKYHINLDIKNNIAIMEDANNKQFNFNQNIEVSLQSTSNKKVEYIKNGKPSDLPSITISVSLI